MALAGLHRNIELRGLTYKRLYNLLEKSDDEFVTFCQQLGFLHTKRTCRKCDFRAVLLLVARKLVILRAAAQTRSETGTVLSSQTVTDWGQYFRDLCAEFFVENPVRIGGEGVFVEIDETYLTRRKYHRGQQRGNHGQWIFGGVVRGDASLCFLVPVEHRDAATLLPIIQKYVIPGSTIISDMWAAYGGIDKLPEGYEHLAVNHSLHFVDPDDPRIHTQSVENCWSRFKRIHRRRHGCPKHMLKDYISEFMWRQKHAGPDTLYHLWEMAVKVYPVELYSPTPSEIDAVAEGEDDEPNEQENAQNGVEANRLSLERVYVDDF